MQLSSWSAEQPSFSLSSMAAARVREAKESKTKSRDIMVVFILIVLCSLEELESMMQGFSGDFLYPSCSQVTRGASQRCKSLLSPPSYLVAGNSENMKRKTNIELTLRRSGEGQSLLSQVLLR